MSIYDAAMKYQAEGVPLVVLAGEEYGTGSSRDWAAKGTLLLGVRAVIAKSFERIHRSNLIGMGVLPLQFEPGEDAQSLGLTGDETFAIDGIADGLTPKKKLRSARPARKTFTVDRAHRYAATRSTTTGTAASCSTCCASSRRRRAERGPRQVSSRSAASIASIVAGAEDELAVRAVELARGRLIAAIEARDRCELNDAPRSSATSGEVIEQVERAVALAVPAHTLR